MPLWTVLGLVAVAGAAVALLSALTLRAAGGSFRTGRRLAGPPEARVGTLIGSSEAAGRTLRVAGRIRCRDPLHAEGGERLVAYHRDVEVRLPRIGWRSLERLREARSFELWDHDGSLTVDPSTVAEPLITIPSIWRGAPTELKEPHASAARMLAERHGEAAVEARATTRTINVTDRLLVLARVADRPGGLVALEPPEGGYLITNLALDDAMRLLGGRHRRLTAAAVAGVGAGSILAMVGLVGALVAAAVRA
ncbi:MAG TPA: hypothetical protein VGA26_02360 [Candidatus Limnocylindria bacterium]